MIKAILKRMLIVVVVIFIAGVLVSIGRQQGYAVAKSEVDEVELYLNECHEREDGWIELLREARGQ